MFSESDSKAFLIRTFSDYVISITNDQCDRLITFYHMLTEWNSRINLTAITEFEDVVRKNFLDSALLLTHPIEIRDYLSDDDNRRNRFFSLERDENTIQSDSQFLDYTEKESAHVIDVGTGAGFPGLVLAILRPDWDIVLLDSLNKRISFLDAVISECGLIHVQTVHGRAEELGQDPAYRSRFDLCVSRAVAELPILVELCVPFLNPDGFFVSYKGPSSVDNKEDESAEHALSELNSRLSFCFKHELISDARYLFGMQRVGEVPDKYPRRAGIPFKRPL